ncbi:MAG: universal stress protein [candidate division WS1 bacterium]|jgi:nucleotide-binding universal stress UspA family protein|nr:universal stress protein [candidate division WS1 bacterium]
MKAIMVGVDGSAYSDVAVQYAIEIADLAQAGVVGAAAVYGDFEGELERDEHTVEEMQGREQMPRTASGWFTEALDNCNEACAVADVEFVPRMLSGNPSEILPEEAQAVDMLVIGAKGQREKHVQLLGDTARRITRSCIKPVLITRERYRPIKRVLIGYDGSPAAGHAVEWVADLACIGDWEVRIVTGAMTESSLAEGAQYAAALVGTRGVDADIALVEGDAPSIIFDAAREWQPDLIAVGGAQKGALTGFFMGEAWPDIVEQAEVPVLRWR